MNQSMPSTLRYESVNSLLSSCPKPKLVIRPQLFKKWITLSTLYVTIYWITRLVSLILIHWIVIYMLDSAIEVLNSCGQKVYYAQQLSNILLHIHRTCFVSSRLKERDILLIYHAFFAFLWLNERHI